MVAGILGPRDKSIVLLLLKTGVRRHELTTLDIEDVDMQAMSLTLKPAAKRSNRVVFFDPETSEVLARWMKARSHRVTSTPALFLSFRGTRLADQTVLDVVVDAAIRAGLHHPESDRLEDHFTPHCCRHWFTTHLRRAGMPREFIQELRGDARREAIDIYDHIDMDELKESYLAHIPQLGV